MVLTLRDIRGAVTGAQIIKPSGEKRLLAGTKKKGSFVAPLPLPKKVETVVIAEGYATSVTTALLMPDAMIVAAIDAGNLPPVAQLFREKYPEARIIIAGDNDHHTGASETGASNTGKIAAEKSASAINGWVTMPPGDVKSDWDDHRQQHGLESSQQAFISGLYQPESGSEKVSLTVIEGGKRTAKDDLKPYVDGRHGGLYWIEPKLDKDSGEVNEKEAWLSSYVEVVGVGEDDAERYLILAWTPEGSNTQRTEAIPLRDIGEREGWAKLKAGGMLITSKSGLKAILADHLQRSGKREMWAIASASGWQCGAYIMPDGEVLGSPEKPVLFNGRSAAARGYTVKGTVDSWRDSVAKLARGNPSMMLGIACALAAPLIGIAGADGFGVHLFGGSSAGKTTTGNAASTVYGEPDVLKLTWYSTALGLVNEAAAHNDGFMPLDEIGQGSNRRAVADAAYALFNGVGKIQGAKEGGNRDVKRWRAMAFSTGEIDMESYIRADGGKINAGQLVRLLNVPITKATEFHGYADGKTHADSMRDACKQNYGAVGRVWINQLASQKKSAVDTVRAAERRWLGLLPDEASEQVRRVASRFAVLEGALLLSQKLTGWSEQESRDALQHSFNAWVNEFGMGNRENKAWVEQAESFLQRFGYSRYLPHPHTDPRDLPIRDLAGYREEREGVETLVFHTFPSVFRDEIAAGANPVAFAQVLADAGMLDKPAKGTTKKTLRIDGKQPRFVVLMMPDDIEE
jgi:putative DNA primase/helicase